MKWETFVYGFPDGPESDTDTERQAVRVNILVGLMCELEICTRFLKMVACFGAIVRWVEKCLSTVVSKYGTVFCVM